MKNLTMMLAAAAMSSLAHAAPPVQMTDAQMARIAGGVPTPQAYPGDYYPGAFSLSNSQKSGVATLPGTYGTSSEFLLYQTHHRADSNGSGAAQYRSATFTFQGL
jgi:hypothetical protein